MSTPLFCIPCSLDEMAPRGTIQVDGTREQIENAYKERRGSQDGYYLLLCPQCGRRGVNPELDIHDVNDRIRYEEQIVNPNKDLKLAFEA